MRSGSHCGASEASTSSHQKSRPAFMAVRFSMRRTTTQLVTSGHMSSALSQISLRRRILPERYP